MKQQTLPTLPEFINKVRNREDNLETIDPISPFAQSLKDLQLIYDFTDKIMEQAHISQFIPCVEENGVWKPIEEPKGYAEWISEYNRGFEHDYEGLIHKQYKTAQSKVLFSGWEVAEITEFYISIKSEKLNLLADKKDGKIYCVTKIETLIQYNLPLTESGVIEFNLKF